MAELTQEEKINAVMKAFARDKGDVSISLSVSNDQTYRAQCEGVIWKSETSKNWRDASARGVTVEQALANLFNVLTKTGSRGNPVQVIIPRLGFNDEYKFDEDKKGFVMKRYKPEEKDFS